MPIIKTVGVISKPNAPAAVELVPKLLEWLCARGIASRIDQETAVYAVTPGMPRHEVPEGCDLVIVLGGDGTLLSPGPARRPPGAARPPPPPPLRPPPNPPLPRQPGRPRLPHGHHHRRTLSRIGTRLPRRASRRQTPPLEHRSPARQPGGLFVR